MFEKIWKLLAKQVRGFPCYVVRKNNADIGIGYDWELDRVNSCRVLKTQEELMQQELDENVHECVKNVRKKTKGGA
jgi:uncharacterized protein (UPF0254 family)